MAAKVERREFGGVVIEVKQLGSRKGMALWLRLMRVAGPAIAVLLTAPKGMKGISKGKLPMELIGPVLEAVAGSASDVDFEAICDALGESSTMLLDDYKRAPFDSSTRDIHFTGKYVELFQWLGFALEVNYGDFIAGIAAALPGKNPEESQGGSDTKSPPE